MRLEHYPPTQSLAFSPNSGIERERAPAPGVVFRALAENPVALKRFERSCQGRAQGAGREARPATPGAGVLLNFGIRV